MLDDKVLASNQNLSSEDSKKVREISHSFGALFEQGCIPKKEAEAQKALGKKLFNLWLASSWEKIKAGVPVGSMRSLVIASDVPEVLNLPWELLLPPKSDFLGIDPRFGIRRLPSSGKKLAPFNGVLRPRPLRLLFMACSPTDLPTLDYEREEEALFRAVSGQNVAFDSCDMGTFEELKEKVSDFKPHIVHLTGHGAVIDGQGRFAFEDEDGKNDLVSSEELRRFLAGSGVQCVFVSGCQTGKAPIEVIGGICQGLVSAEVPLAVGWAASIADDLATNFARTFYKNLKDAQPVDRALLLARQEAWKVCQKRGDPSWTLPVLYSATNQSMIFDPDTQRSVEEPSRPAIVQEALPGMKEGYAEHFVGCRREQQRLLPALRSGDLQIVIITGMGGSGKSALATRLARKLETYGFIPIPVPSSKENPLNSARLLQTFGEAFRKSARKHKAKGETLKANEISVLAQDLDDPKQSIENKIHDAVDALNSEHFLLLLDNFESNMDESDRHILDAEISGFYQYLLGHLTGGSRVIITTRYQPSDVPTLPLKAHREELSDFAESSFLKILQRDPQVEQRVRSSELPMELLRDLYHKFGGTPRFLLQIREAIKEMDAEMLKKDLAKVELSSDIKPAELQKIRDKYFDDIFTERLYSYLSPESQVALSRSAVYGVPVNMEGLAAAAGESLERVEAFAHEWKDRAFAYQETGKELWFVYGLLRSWLLGRLTEQDRKAAYKAAGDFLIEMRRKKRTDELGISSVDCLMDARAKYLQAKEYREARNANDIISVIFYRNAIYDQVRRINQEMLGYEEHPLPMGRIALIYFEQGDFLKAREWYQKSLGVSGDISKEAGMAWHGLASIDLRQGKYKEAEDEFRKSLEIALQIGDKQGEGTILNNLASIDYKQGRYKEAEDKFQKSFVIAQQIRDRLGEAAALNNLAAFDLERGEYKEALKKLQTALKITQESGNRAGEAATFGGLGFLAVSMARAKEGLRLVALCYLIDESIDHGDTKKDFEAISKIASRLNYTQEQLVAMLKEVEEAYQKDRGKGLIEAAFGKV